MEEIRRKPHGRRAWIGSAFHEPCRYPKGNATYGFFPFGNPFFPRLATHLTPTERPKNGALRAHEALPHTSPAGASPLNPPDDRTSAPSCMMPEWACNC